MKVAVIGSGAWGTALAIRLCKNGHDVTMWTFEKELVDGMVNDRHNPRLPNAVLPEGLKAAGAQGVVINHCEKPMSLPQMKATIDRARELDFLVFACADTLDEAKAIANLHPDIINPEPSAIIGGGNGVSPMAYVKDSIRVIKEIDPDIMVEQAAGITNGQQVYDFIMAGSEAAGAASGIMNAADPIAMIDEMIAATRRAADDLKKQNA